MAKHILVIGGSGFLGARVVTELREGGNAVSIGGRGAEVAIDLAAGRGLEQLDGFDAIINCADSIAAPPDAAIARVLERGGVWLDAGAHAPTIARVLGRHRSQAPGAGVAVLGVGLFPGISNLMAASLHRGAGGARVTVAIRISPLSGAGPATIALMRAALEGDALPEEPMLEASRVAGDVTFAMPRPVAPLYRGFRRIARAHPRLARPVIATLAASLRLVRRVLFRRRLARIEIRASAPGASLAVIARDGFSAAAAALAATSAMLLERGAPPGLHLPDELMGLDELLARMNPGAVTRS